MTIGSRVFATILVGLVSTVILFGAVSHSPAPGPIMNSLTLPGAYSDFQMTIQPYQFLMRTGSGANSSLVLGPYNGFVGSVILSAHVSPALTNAPTISNLLSSVKLNASQTSSVTVTFDVNSTANTSLGLYTITITGASGSIFHTASATVGVTNAFVPGNGAELVYFGNFVGTAYPGGSISINNTFEDLGYVPVGIWNITVQTSFGVFHESPGPLLGTSYLIENPYGESSTLLAIQIPPNTKPGNYQVTATIRWVVEPYNIYQAPGPDLATQSNLTVYANPTGPSIFNAFTPIVLAGIGAVAAAAVLAVGLVLWHEKRRKLTPGHSTNVGASSIGVPTQTCPNCGTLISVGKFCPKCGHQISQI